MITEAAPRMAAVIIGPPEHGVVLVAHQLAGQDSSIRLIAEPDVEALRNRRGLIAELKGVQTVHVHFTDQLFGRHCVQSAAGFATLVAVITAKSRALVSVTLHDVPLFAEQTARYQRRAAAYASVIGSVKGRVVVNSEHEARQVRRFANLDPVVIPLPIASCTQRQSEPCGDRTTSTTPADVDVAIVGFIYPGKGHEEALRALAGLPSSIGLKAIGRPADTHDAMVEQLTSLARLLERRFTVTGFLAEAALLTEMRSATVPLAAHHRISASASICAWLGAGRRPLVPDGPWTRELRTRCPGSVTLYRATGDGLADAIAAAIADPASTWLAPDALVSPDPAEAAALYGAASRRFLGSSPVMTNRVGVG